ncbi:MAG: GNAT family N-acetyltransferase [Hyphomicrobiales bacterium]|nr:MAG: GNAT family N-acetyltransferase [Hyphomicrobiales bacterium]
MLPAVADIEAATLSAWPALQVAHDRLWLWRGARGYSKRANSIHCLDPSDGDDAGARLERMAALSRYNDIPPVFRVTPLTSRGAIAALDRAGWQKYEQSLVLAASLSGEDLPVRHATRLYDPRDPEWFETQGAMSGYNPHTIGILKAILEAAAHENCGILAHDEDGRPVAAALATVVNGIGVYLNVVTREEARGGGFGRAVMAAALNWTRQAGATSAAIQVLAGNAPALGLYGSLGFAQVYDYHYRSPAP